jgi:hypothetical protein
MRNRTLYIMIAVAAGAAITQAGPIDPLYLVGNGSLSIVQGSSVTTVSTLNPIEAAVAVAGTVRTVGFFASSGSGHEYTLAGVPTGNSYSNTLGEQLLDGTTNGVFNYSILWDDTGNPANDRVYRFNADWSSPQYLFTVQGSDFYGITYDAVNNSLWVSSRSGQIQDYTLGGTLLSSFGLPQRPNGLAIDPRDRTLWFNTTTDSSLYQYSTSGTLLSSQNYAGAPFGNGMAFGVEFAETAPAPEAATWLLTGIAPLMIGIKVRKGRP